MRIIYDSALLFTVLAASTLAAPIAKGGLDDMAKTEMHLAKKSTIFGGTESAFEKRAKVWEDPHQPSQSPGSPPTLKARDPGPIVKTLAELAIPGFGEEKAAKDVAETAWHVGHKVVQYKEDKKNHNHEQKHH